MDEAMHLADEALQYAIEAHDRVDEVEHRVHVLEKRLLKALNLLIEQHPYGARAVLELDEEAFE